jgi:hypothetical protein
MRKKKLLLENVKGIRYFVEAVEDGKAILN